MSRWFFCGKALAEKRQGFGKSWSILANHLRQDGRCTDALIPEVLAYAPRSNAGRFKQITLSVRE
jgi:hypothetical protein